MKQSTKIWLASAAVFLLAITVSANSESSGWIEGNELIAPTSIVTYKIIVHGSGKSSVSYKWKVTGFTDDSIIKREDDQVTLQAGSVDHEFVLTCIA